MAILPSAQPEAGGSYVPPEQRKQKKLIILFLIVLLVTAGVVYYGFFYSASVSETLQQGAEGLVGQDIQNIIGGQGDDFSFVRRVSLEDDFDLFDDPKFAELKEFVPLLDISGQRGRVNPFARY